MCHCCWQVTGNVSLLLPGKVSLSLTNNMSLLLTGTCCCTMWWESWRGWRGHGGMWKAAWAVCLRPLPTVLRIMELKSFVIKWVFCSCYSFLWISLWVPVCMRMCVCVVCVCVCGVCVCVFQVRLSIWAFFWCSKKNCYVLFWCWKIIFPELYRSVDVTATLKKKTCNKSKPM